MLLEVIQGSQMQEMFKIAKGISIPDALGNEEESVIMAIPLDEMSKTFSLEPNEFRKKAQYVLR